MPRKLIRGCLPQSGKVVALDITLPVKQAFHALYREGISMAPLWDSNKCQFVGMLSAMDFILVLKEMGIHGSNLTEEQLETHTIAVWRETQECRTDSNGRTYPQHMVHVYTGILSTLLIACPFFSYQLIQYLDIIALVKDKVYARISLSGFSIHQALLLGRDARFSCRLHNGPRCHMCLRSDSLHKERLANPGVRQLVVIEAGSRRVEGIISIGNVFRILLS
ncbi:Sucrose nonfermenting 4-like protein [Glycine max]|nr:Sucrose nonfermenting 4-like protein [Glycine max]